MRRFLLRAFLPSPAVIAAIAAFIATLAQPNNPDTLWHLAVGKWILAQHAIPDISRFYYSATAGFGYDYSWLSQAALFGAWHVLGGTGIAILNSVVAGFIFYLLYKLLERNSPNLLVNFTVLGVALMTISVYLSGRPVIFTVAFLALEILILSDFVHRSSFIVHRSSSIVHRSSLVVHRSSRLIWLIPPMTALWANLHPGFAVAPLLILLFLPMARKPRDRWTLAACLAATVGAVILNPYGWKMYLMPLEIARSMSTLRGLTEWTSVSGWEAVVWGSLVALVTCGLALRRQPFPVILLAALTALAAGLSSRNMPLFGVVSVFVLGRTLLPVLLRKKVEVEVKVENGFVSHASTSNSTSASTSTSTSASTSTSTSAFASAFLRKFDVRFEPAADCRSPIVNRQSSVANSAGGWFWAIAIPLLLIIASRSSLIAHRLSFDFSGYPVAAVRYIEEHDRPGNLFVRETWSGYLLWTMPDQKLFYDAKGGFSREAAQGHSELIKPKAGWRDVADRYGLSTFLLERGSPLAVVLSEAPDWRLEYSDSLAEVFVRRPEAAARPGSTDSSEAHASPPPY